MKLVADGDRVELGGTGEELRDWIHVDDAVAMMQGVVELASEQCPVFNGGSGVGVRISDMVSLLARALRRPKRIEFSRTCRPGDPIVVVADAARIAAAGHTCHVALNVGVQRYADWSNHAREE